MEEINAKTTGYSIRPVASYVEINGVKWATRNVGQPYKFAESPAKTGMLYQWNRNVGWTYVDPLQDSNGGTTWNSTVPGGTEWESVNDPSPSGYRLPTKAE